MGEVINKWGETVSYSYGKNYTQKSPVIENIRTYFYGLRVGNQLFLPKTTKVIKNYICKSYIYEEV